MMKLARTTVDVHGVTSDSQQQKKQRVHSNETQPNKPTEVLPNPNFIPKVNPKIPDPDSPFSLTLVDRSLFTCSFCHKFLTTPVQQCIAEAHALCSICAPELEDDRCRHCYAKTFKDYSLVNDMLDSFQVPCQNVSFGCRETAMSLGEKRSQEEGCVFVPCYCPLCHFACPISQLASHFKDQHLKCTSTYYPKLLKSFDFDTKFSFDLYQINEFSVFQEGKEGDLFLAFKDAIKGVGVVISVRRMGPIRPPSPEREYFYEIELHQVEPIGRDKMKDNMSLKLLSPMTSVRNRLEKLRPRSNFLMIPEGLCWDDSVFCLQLTVRIWWQNVK